MILSWMDIDRMVHSLRETLCRQPFDVVVGIARSGLVPATMLSHILGVREFAVLDIRRTLDDTIDCIKHEPILRGGLNLDSLTGKRVLLVDDIVGAGATILAARAEVLNRCASLTTVALVVNEANLGSRPLAEVIDYYATTVRGWVVFPWEGKGVR